LISPFTSIRDLFQFQVGRFADIVEDRFQNLHSALKITSPTLIVHGAQDGLVPTDHGRAIYRAISSRRMLVTPEHMSHNTSLLKDVGTFILPMTHFFSLPDYTFEDIEVPEWAFPRAPFDGLMQKDEAFAACGLCSRRAWICGRLGLPGALDDGMVDPVSRLDPLGDQRKELLEPKFTAYGAQVIPGGPVGSSSRTAILRPRSLSGSLTAEGICDSQTQQECDQSQSPTSPRVEVAEEVEASQEGSAIPMCSRLNMTRPAASEVSQGMRDKGALEVEASREYQFGRVIKNAFLTAF
jgi:hypothetical protein